MSSTRSERLGASAAQPAPPLPLGCGRGFNEQLAQGVEADEIEGLQRHIIARQGAERLGDGRQGRLLAFVDCLGERIERRFFLGQQAVDDQELLGEADCRQLAMGARCFAQGGVLSAGDEDEPGALSIREGLHGGIILCALLFEARERAEARGVAFARFEKARPGDGQLQQPDGVAGRRGVENNVVVGAK